MYLCDGRKASTGWKTLRFHNSSSHQSFSCTIFLITSLLSPFQKLLYEHPCEASITIKSHRHRHLNPCMVLLSLQPQKRTSISIRVISNETFIETHSKCGMSCTPIHSVDVTIRAPSTKVYQPQPFIPSKF